MKSQRTNAFQLAVAGGVMVLVMVCATFAWFAAGDFSFVRGIRAGMTPHKVPTQINQIEYSPTGGSDADWTVYDGSPLDFEPGKTWHFRVRFTALSTDVYTMKLINIDKKHRTKPSKDETTTNTDPDKTTVPTTLAPTDSPAKLTELLQYSVNGSEFRALDIDPETNRSAYLGEPTSPQDAKLELVDGQFICYYDIKMVGGVPGVNYDEFMDLQLSFDLEMPFQTTLQ